ncbi:MAG TPA: glycosyltransferase family 87 protein [Burkholderiaceae bacterium]|nr:glycosyltransferase family 87 protein [Burkholderiaceae bacterium]
MLKGLRQRTDPSDGWRVVALLIAMVAGNLLLHLLLVWRFGGRVLPDQQAWLAVYGFDDSWRNMAKAYEWLKHTEPGALLYQSLLIDQHVKFQYPPSSLLLNVLAERVGVPFRPEWLNAIGWIFMALQAAVCAKLTSTLMRRVSSHLGPGEHMSVPMAWGFMALSILLFYPVMRAYGLSTLAERIGVPFRPVWLKRIGWIFMALQVAVFGKLTSTFMCRVSGDAGRREHMSVLAAGILAALSVLLFYPAMKAFSLGQVQAWLNAWFVVACWCWFSGRRELAGLFVGAILLFKPQFALFFFWGLLRREWRFVFGMALVVIPGELVALRLFGLSTHLDYLAALRFLSHVGEAFYPNQSINGVLNRVLGNGEALRWQVQGFPPYSPSVYLGTVLSSIVLIGSSLFFRFRSGSVGFVDFLIAGLSFTMASPIAWEHHYGGTLGIVFPVLVVLTVGVSSLRSPVLAATLVLAYVVSSQYLPPRPGWASGSGSLVLSYLYCMAALMLVLLYRVRDRVSNCLDPDGSSSTPPHERCLETERNLEASALYRRRRQLQ